MNKQARFNSEPVIGYSGETHRRRLRNLSEAHAAVRTCRCCLWVRNYLPGQAFYNLGEYPCPFSMAPAEYDHRKLAALAADGVRVILLLEEWNDSQRRLGADKFTAHDEPGFQAFVDLCHGHGMKVLPYLSSGYFESRDPDFRPDWIHPKAKLNAMYLKYVACCPASPEWRAYLLPRSEQMLSRYGTDGFFLDLGYPVWKLPEFMGRPVPCDGADEPDRQGHVSPNPESPEHDAALEDLLGLIHDLAHRYGGIINMHYGYDAKVAAREKIYDYVMAGETVVSLDHLRETIKDWDPYVLTLNDARVANIPKEDDLYINTIPYMQFPIRLDGRPMTGQRGFAPGVTYATAENDPYADYMRGIWDFYQKHPEGPYSYLLWDPCPPNPVRHATWTRYFRFYQPMVAEGGRAWIDIRECELFEGDFPRELVASLFVNDETYLVLANYGARPVMVKTKWEWRDRESPDTGKIWTIESKRIRLLERNS
jgi:hypothetical protein